MRAAIIVSAAAGSLATAAFLLGLSSLHAQDEPSPPIAAPEGDGQTSPQDAEILARGEYLVQGVAMCQECHTPRDAEGELIPEQLLMGASMPVLPPAFVERWGRRAPAIAGLPGYTDDEAVRLLTEGITSRGTVPRPPMPQYRFSDEDARAVVAYLMSLQ
jgi:mono/diheme cytochrome c family protein